MLLVKKKYTSHIFSWKPENILSAKYNTYFEFVTKRQGLNYADNNDFWGTI